MDDPTPLRFSPVSDAVGRLDAFDVLVASPPIVLMLARRLGVDSAQLSAALRPQVVTLSAEVPMTSSHGYAANGLLETRASDLVAPTALEFTVRTVLAERLDEPPGPAPAPYLFSEARTSLINPGSDIGTCPVCNAPLAHFRGSDVAATPTHKPGAKHNLGWLRRRTLRAGENQRAIAAAQVLLSWEGTAFVVASGGSAIAGAYIAQLLRERTSLFAAATFPSDYVAAGTRSDALILVSFSGSTPDHIPVIRRARQLGVERIALICRPPTPTLAPELGPGGLVIGYGSARRPSKSERGFVSMAATAAPCALLLAAVDGPAALTPLATPRLSNNPSDLGAVLAGSVVDGREVHVLGSGYARPAMLDLESKWVEGDLGPLTVHQSKDFSHGRFMSLLGSGRSAVPVILSTGIDEYERELMATLQREHRASAGRLARPLHLAAGESSLIGGLDLLLGVQELAAATAAYLGRDLSRPERIDPKGLQLYTWNAPVDDLAPPLDLFPR
jgi:fructoselysine-6-P-deglycase FrlB-like protein